MIKKNFSLNEIFNQAVSKTNAVVTEMPLGINVIYLGIKIQKFEDQIQILDLNKGGSYYKLIDPAHYQVFYDYGWKIGCLKMAIHNCVYKLELVEERIKTEVNTRKNDKHIQNLKNKREKLLQKHYAYNNKLNQIQKQNEKLL